MKAGYWDQNIRDPGSQLPRDGGTPYTQAWNQVLADPAVHHVNIESWNEYDEGSGIYRANPGPPLHPARQRQHEYRYVVDHERSAAIHQGHGRRRPAFNDTPDRDAQILWHNLPTQLQPGQVIDASVVVRNMGDLSWTGAQQFEFGQHLIAGEAAFAAGFSLIDDTQNGIPTYGGIFRGAPITFQVELDRA